MDPDPGSIYLYIILIALLLIGGGYFAACETAFTSVSDIRLITYADDGDNRAKTALTIKEKFDEALTAILIGNNIMHIGLSSVATLLASRLGGNSAVTISTFITTFVVFIFAEMIPKAYAKDCNEKVSLVLASSLYVIIKILTPLTFIFSSISVVLSKLFGANKEDNVTVTEEELFDIIENIDDKDEIEEDEAELVKSALDFTTKTAKDVLMPLSSVVHINEKMSASEIEDLIINGEYSRLPVVKDNEPIGVLQIRKYLKNKIANKKNLIPKSCLDKVVYIKETMPIDEVLDYLSKQKAHMGFVRNKDKELLGILTVEDLLEELFGEIYDEEEKERVKL